MSNDKSKNGSGSPQNGGGDKGRNQGGDRGKVIRPGDNVKGGTGTTSTGPRGPHNGKK